MGYFVERVVICDAYTEPDRHYQLQAGGRSKLAEGRRPSLRYLASARDARGGIAGVVGKQAGLFEDMLASTEQHNDFVNGLREEVRAWRDGEGAWAGNTYGGTALVTRRLLEWWFERDEERKAEGKRFFFCQREAIETVIYLYEVKNRQKMPETGALLRYALKLATGTGKTVVMALLVTWATLHKRKVSGSTLAANFLVLVPNLTVRDRVSGVPRGDGLDRSGEQNLYDAFEMVPPEYDEEFAPTVVVKNWQAIPLEGQRDDWISNEVADEGRFIPASVLWALERRSREDPGAPLRRMLGNWRDVVVINDEAHHAYGEQKTKRGEDSSYIRWSKILDRLSAAMRVGLVVDLSATPWYGSGSPKPDGTLFEWLVSDFSVYDAFESGLVKVVRLPSQEGDGSAYLNLWDLVREAKTKEEYLSACRGAIASIYASWSEDFNEWRGTLEFMRGPSPVLLVVANDATRAKWLFEHLTTDYDLLRNPDDEERGGWVTLQIDSKVFDAEKGAEALVREMVNTVGKPGASGECVRCIVSVNMLSEGWDVKSVTHILGLRAFGSPLLTEQIIGRGLRRTNYDVLNQPLSERPEGYEETVDAFGIPFLGFPVQRKRRGRAGEWGHKPVWIEAEAKRDAYRVRVPNVRAWAVGITRPLEELVRVADLPELVVNPERTPSEISMYPVVGGGSETVMRLDDFRAENPLLKTAFVTARDLLERLSPRGAAAADGDAIDVGPTFDELLGIARAYLETRVRAVRTSDRRDVGIYFWRLQVIDILENAIRGSGLVGMQALPILGTPEHLDTARLRRFQWTGIVADGRKSHTAKVPCHSPLEADFVSFLDGARDVARYFKNERFGFSITYYEHHRPRQYFPDFVVVTRGDDGSECYWLAETKGEVHPNTSLKRQAAEAWCAQMSTTTYGTWRYLFVQQRAFEQATVAGVRTFGELAERLSPRPMAVGALQQAL